MKDNSQNKIPDMDRKMESQVNGKPKPGQSGMTTASPAMSQMAKMGAANQKIEKARDPKKVMRRLAMYLRPHFKSLIGITALVIVNTGMELLGPFLFGYSIDRFISTKDFVGLARISVWILAGYAIAWFAQYGQNYGIAGITHRMLKDLRKDLFEHLQTLSLQFFDKRPTGELMSRLTNDIDAIRLVLSQSIIDLTANLLTLLGIVGMMFLLNPWLALGAIIILPLMFWLTAKIGKGARSGFRDVQANLGKLNSIVEENTSGARVVQAFRRHDKVIEEFDQANIKTRDLTIRAQSLMMIIRPLLMVLSNVDLAIVAALGGWMVIRGMVTVGVVATFLIYTRRFFEPLFSLADLYNSIQAALAGAERVFEILDQKPGINDRKKAISLKSAKGLVEFERVTFGYENGVDVLKDVSLRAEPGQKVALVGPTGAGKTTIVSLLTRFYDVDKGVIKLDGRDIRVIMQDDLRRQLGIVLQDTFLFSDSVLENIRFGRLDATDDECIQAATMANADQFIKRLPNGYHTMLSERASNLSSGQRQLISISRAILADPRILILDEATSDVDSRTEIHIQEALTNLMVGRTSFIIAHRLSTIRNADQVLVIKDGRIIEHGTHESLLDLKGFYHNLYMSQFAYVNI